MQRRVYTNDPEDSPAAALYEWHTALIFAYLRLYADSLEDAEDMLLEVFLAALEWKPIYRLWGHEQIGLSRISAPWFQATQQKILSPPVPFFMNTPHK